MSEDLRIGKIRLHSTCHIICSDEDQLTVADIEAGFTEDNELAIALSYDHYPNSRRNEVTCAIVNKEDAEAMARRHELKYEELPEFISDCMYEWQEMVNPGLGQVRGCFKEITECLLDEGCRFKIVQGRG